MSINIRSGGTHSHNQRFQMRIGGTLGSLTVLAAAFALVVFSKQSVEAAKAGLSLCLEVIIPSLFPFFVLSAMTVRLGADRRLGKMLEPVMKPLFNVGGACSAALVLGLMGGYPVGAKTVAELYEKGSCSKTEGERMLAFCNNSGPAFIFGVVGAGIFASGSAGLLLYLIHAASSICVGLMFRSWKSGHEQAHSLHHAAYTPVRFSVAFTDSIKSAFQSTLSICAFVIFFTVVIKLLTISNIIPALAKGIALILTPFGFREVWAERLLTGFVELTTGILSLRPAAGPEPVAAMAAAAFMLGWGGISVHCQTISFLRDSGLGAGTYLVGKLLQGCLSAVFVLLLWRFAAFSVPTSTLAAVRTPNFVFPVIIITGIISALLFLLLFVGIKKTASK